MVWETGEANKNKDIPIFTPLKDVEQKSGLNVLIYGGFGTGKSHFALTAPEPVYVIDTEKGVKPLLENFKDKEIYVLNVYDSSAKDTYENILNSLKELHVLQKEGKVGTIVFDSITDLWEVCQTYAKEEIWKMRDADKIKQQWDWGVINKLYYKVLRNLLFSFDCNIILTARMGEIYVAAGQPTGSYKPKCQKETEYWTGVNVFNETKVINGQYQFISTVEKCKENGSIQGKTFNNLTFDKLKEEVGK